MKLLFDLPEKDQATFDASVAEGEKVVEPKRPKPVTEEPKPKQETTPIQGTLF